MMTLCNVVSLWWDPGTQTILGKTKEIWGAWWLSWLSEHPTSAKVMISWWVRSSHQVSLSPLRASHWQCRGCMGFSLSPFPSAPCEILSVSLSSLSVPFTLCPLLTHALFLSLKKKWMKVFLCLFIFERERVWAGEGRRERETQNPKQLQALSCQHRGSNPQTVRSRPVRPWAKIWRSTDWATQVPHEWNY